jgi:hypothetical protein
VLSASNSLIFCTKQSHPWVWLNGLNRNVKTWSLLDRYFQLPITFFLHTDSRPQNFFGTVTVALQDTHTDIHSIYFTLLLFTLRATSHCHLVSFTRILAWKHSAEENKKYKLYTLPLTGGEWLVSCSSRKALFVFTGWVSVVAQGIRRKIRLSQPVIEIGIPGLLVVNVIGTYRFVPQAIGMHWEGRHYVGTFLSPFLCSFLSTNSYAAMTLFALRPRSLVYQTEPLSSKKFVGVYMQLMIKISTAV